MQMQCGDYAVPAADAPRFQRFLSLIAPRLEAAARSGKPKQVARFRRIAEHFLTAGEAAFGEGDVLSEQNAESVLHYVIALEALLTGDQDGKTELTRKVFQRAAILAGTNDEERLKVSNIVKSAYRARSEYAHGSTEPATIDLPPLRRVIRDCITARLLIDDPTPGGLSLAGLADSALLNHSILDQDVRAPVEAFWAESTRPVRRT